MTQIILPKSERKDTLKVKRGTPETVAETYETSSDLKMTNERYSLFVFDVGNMDVVHKRKIRRFGESYRFISRTSEEIKEEVGEKAGQNGVDLVFQEPLPKIYGAVLKDVASLLEVRAILGNLEKRYS